jgi:hypothetical protein
MDGVEIDAGEAGMVNSPSGALTSPKEEGLASVLLRGLSEAEQPCEVEWHFADGIYVRQIAVPKADTLLPQHAHQFDHISFVARGAVYLWKDGVLDKQYRAPTGIFIKAGIKHSFMTTEDDTTLLCVHNLKGDDKVAVLAEHDLMDEI